jgi:hypothetical protein
MTKFTSGIWKSSTKALIEKGTFTEKQGAPHREKSLALWKAVEDNWDEFKFKHEEYLRGYSIEFDENDNATLTDENNSGKSDYQDARKIDNFKKANAAIKMLLSTVARVDRDGNMDRSTVNGAKLIPTSEVFMKVMNQVHSAKTIEEMLQGLKELGLKDNNYKALYERLTKSAITVKGIDYSNLTEPHEAQLLASLWKTFKKMNADVKAVFILSNDDVVIGDSNLSSALVETSPGVCVLTLLLLSLNSLVPDSNLGLVSTFGLGMYIQPITVPTLSVTNLILDIVA